MIWFFIFIIIVFGLVISKSGPIEKKESNVLTRKQIDVNLKDYPNEYIFSVSGVHLSHNSYAVYNICKEFDLITLVPEPDNSFDSKAIKVEDSGWHFGYVPKDETNEVHQIIKKDHIAYIESRNILDYISVYVKIRYKN